MIQLSKFQPGASPYADAEDDTAGLTSEGMHESDPTQDKLFTDLLAKGIREMLAENTQDGNKGTVMPCLMIYMIYMIGNVGESGAH